MPKFYLVIYHIQYILMSRPELALLVLDMKERSMILQGTAFDYFH